MGEVLASWAKAISNLPRLSEAPRLAAYTSALEPETLTPVGKLVAGVWLTELPNQMQEGLLNAWRQALAAQQVCRHTCVTGQEQLCSMLSCMQQYECCQAVAEAALSWDIG